MTARKLRPADEEFAWPENGDAGTLQAAGTVENQVGEQVIVER